ncbi:cell division protein [Vibrio aestuarianus]|uniref:cell division protein n=1 Tax=Vibrio aestuarianus TaxID=28171 RepID=UPI00237CE548|nr:cell division protein [Vibrio aestuarianus]MDE1315281.1 cell division protein [Vibrio aestuarianus]
MLSVRFRSIGLQTPTPAETSLIPLAGVGASIVGIWLEMHLWKGVSEEQKH